MTPDAAALKYAVGAACAVVPPAAPEPSVPAPSRATSRATAARRVQNIGRRDAGRPRRYGPIDVVYTWVNGSDPSGSPPSRTAGKHRGGRLLWNDDYRPTTAPEIPPRRVQGPLGRLPDSWAETVEREKIGHLPRRGGARPNRYRDTGELRYSLRSLESSALVRHVYLVTDDRCLIG